MALDEILGVTELGVLFSTLLFGVMIVQCYTYSQANFNDVWPIKTLVIFVLALETLHTAVLWAYMYTLTVTEFGVYEKLECMHWTVGLSIPLETLITYCVQSFYAIQVYRLSKKLWYPVVFCTLSLARMAGGIALTVVGLGAQMTFTNLIERYKWLIGMAMPLAVVVDAGNTIALCYWLIKAKADVKSMRSEKITDKLILWSVETGLITSICVTVMLICVVTMTNLVWMSFFTITAKLYSNSLLATLNSRVGLRATYYSTTNPLNTSALATVPIEFARRNDLEAEGSVDEIRQRCANTDEKLSAVLQMCPEAMKNKTAA